MKSTLKNILASILEWQVRRLRNRNNFKIIGVVGSIGKTSTKLAIAKVLESEKRVRYQEGNYNDIISVPLIFFGHTMPSIWNVFSWIKIIFQNEIQIYSDFLFDFVIVELGTDAPNQINQFRKYLYLDIAVVTAVALEHMEFFDSLKDVSEEEWSVNYFSEIIFANKDLCSVVPENIDHKKVFFYGKDFGSIFKIENISKIKEGFSFDILKTDKKIMDLSVSVISEVQLYSIVAAVIVAKTINISDQKIKEGVKQIAGFAGRMQKLKGIKNSLIIDDTYNASPSAVKMAIDTLKSYPTLQRIAILGMMNELGDISKEEHKKIGRYCDPKSLDLIVTIGEDANEFLAPEAIKNGCNVYRAKNSIDAGEYLKDKIKEKAVILAKGSQNGVFAEEALKPLLANPSDISKLVRQDAIWMKKKQS
ncbi:MAG: UDP-N-acetylmuramoyl-tripeptide-D-alanyl-D-alanine ligase [Parcubacteria group bacterium GW2011_GWB1_35_5]|nr:MAG: UDP-N-acetylmuramoyl-tripeptide-D-alanyl-D-alanine ligase [Parcubacteria group bacterium GW2011_GWB1_35_5]